MSDRELLTLIPVFDAIISEGNLSRAAERLGVTQSAVSQALARLRKLTSDPLFESHGRGVRPTPRALEIAGHARAALTHANAAFTPKTLDIASLKRTFIIDIGGGFDALILPKLYKVLAKAAPGVRCLVSNTRGGDLLSELKYGETELAFDFQPTDAEGISSERLGEDTPVVVARPGHPALKQGLTKSLYLQLPHAALAWTRSTVSSGVALELDAYGNANQNRHVGPHRDSRGCPRRVIGSHCDHVAIRRALAGRPVPAGAASAPVSHAAAGVLSALARALR